MKISRFLPFLLSGLAAGAAAHEMTPVGPAFVVTSRTANDQHDPWIGCDDEGNFVIAYAQGDVFLRRLAPDGTPFGDDVQVNTTLTGGTQDEPYVAVDPATGDFVVCYSDRHGNDGDMMGAAGRFFAADGTPRGPEAILNTTIYQSQFEPHATFAVDGTVMVAWGDAAIDGSSGCVGRLFDRSGAPLSAEFLINEASSATQIDPSLSCSRDGLFVCAYVDASGATGEPREVMVRLFNSAGAPLGASQLVNSSSAGMQRDPSVAMDADGDFVVVWQDESATDGDGFGIFARLFDASGTPKGAQFLVTEVTAGNQEDPHVTIDYVGNFVVTWESNASGDFDVFLRRFDRHGTALSGDVLVHESTDGNQTMAKSCLTQSGERLVSIWHDSNGDLYSRAFRIPSIQVNGSAALRQSVTVDLDLPGMGGRNYVVLPSLGTTPTISVNGSRTLALAADELMQFAVDNPESYLFSQLAGTLDGNGQAQATFSVPDDVDFFDLGVHLAAVTLEPGQSSNWDIGSGNLSGIASLSEVIMVQVEGPTRFHPGQEILSEIVDENDEDWGSFQATKGEKLKLKIVAVDELLLDQSLGKLRIEILDADRTVLKSWVKKVPKGKKKIKKQFKVKQSGRYSVRLSSADDSVGHVRLRSSHKVGKKARKQKKKQKVRSSGYATVKVLAVKDTLLTVTAKPLGGAPPAATIEIESPEGNDLDIESSLLLTGETLEATAVMLDETGLFVVRVPGSQGDRYKIVVTPVPPDSSGSVTLE